MCIRDRNTSSASVPLTLCKCFGGEQEGQISVLMSGFGVGLSCGVMSSNICKKDILPIIETDQYFEEGIITVSYTHLCKLCAKAL